MVATIAVFVISSIGLTASAYYTDQVKKSLRTNSLVLSSSAIEELFSKNTLATETQPIVIVSDSSETGATQAATQVSKQTTTQAATQAETQAATQIATQTEAQAATQAATQTETPTASTAVPTEKIIKQDVDEADSGDRIDEVEEVD